MDSPNPLDANLRVFIALSLDAVWPEVYPPGKLIPDESKHMTLVFLGAVSHPTLTQIKSGFPDPSWMLGPAGFFDAVEFLPPRAPRVVVWHAKWVYDPGVATYQTQLKNWVSSLGIQVERRVFLPHVTLARSPFEMDSWKKQFVPLPFCVTGVHVFRSFPNSVYQSLWERPLKPVFEELEHTADRAYSIRGRTYADLLSHAWLTLSGVEPGLLTLPFPRSQVQNLNQVVEQINVNLSMADEQIGVPVKAVSYAGDVKPVTQTQPWIEWKMICDV
jgi:2'-5' RNA ligase